MAPAGRIVMIRLSRSFFRPRFGLRRFMVIVAVLGLFLGLVDLARRRHRLQLQALKHEVLAEIFQRGHAETSPDLTRAQYHTAMWIKYLRAADRPWISVEPDPPRP